MQKNMLHAESTEWLGHWWMPNWPSRNSPGRIAAKVSERNGAPEVVSGEKVTMYMIYKNNGII